MEINTTTVRPEVFVIEKLWEFLKRKQRHWEKQEIIGAFARGMKTGSLDIIEEFKKELSELEVRINNK